MEQDDAVTYCREVWKAVCEKAGTNPGLSSSPQDFDLMFSWRAKGIPLRIVLRGIQDTQGKAPRVAYYRGSVEDAFTYWRHSLGLH